MRLFSHGQRVADSRDSAERAADPVGGWVASARPRRSRWAHGAGKSTLAAGLAKSLGFRLFAERVDDNPFFTRFAADPPTWVFRSQLAFMVNAVSDAIEARRSGDAVIDARSKRCTRSSSMINCGTN